MDRLRLISCFLFLAGTLFSGSSCKPLPGEKVDSTDSLQKENIVFAKGFSIAHGPGFTLLEVSNPWQGSRNTRYRYVLAACKDSVPEHLEDLPFIKTPVSKIVCLSTTQLAMINSLGANSAITGLSGTAFVFDSLTRNRIAAGKIREVGYEQGLDLEVLLQMKPDLILAYGVGAEITGTVSKLDDMGLQVVFDSEYLEKHPLAKTEWIRFLAVILGREKEADSIFEGVRERYERLVSTAAGALSKPVVMTGLPWKDSWNVPPGNSTTAAFIADAGGVYLWNDLRGADNFSLSLEEVVASSAKASVWINAGIARCEKDIVNTDERLKAIPAVKQHQLYNNNRRMGSGGGNDFWESGVMNPDMILADLVAIFHPELMRGHQLNYYVKLQ
ncbi:MAG: ABC transporter substrate-binding protein [Bacteroidales bacterium]